MTDQSNTRTDAARRHDDHDMIEAIEPTPSQGGRSGGTLQRDIATQAEEERFLDGGSGVTRVRQDDRQD